MTSFSDVPATILVVDDRDENIVALRAVLDPLGHRLLMARSGIEALRYLLTHDIALILLDVHMPGMTGFETAARIKERERTRDIPIIFLTAYSNDVTHAVQGFSHGAVDYLTKPIDAAVLRAKVAVFIELYQKTRLLAKRLDQHFEAEARTLRKLADAAVVINSTLSLKDILAVISTSAQEIIGAREAQAVAATGGEVSEVARLALEHDAPVRMTRADIKDALASRGLVDVPEGHPLLEGWLAVPVIGRTGHRLGAIHVADKVVGEFNESDQMILLQLAQLAAVAIENADRYEQEHRIAATLQRSLLPASLPTLPGLELAPQYQPGRAGTQAGGDWYDVFPLDDERVALTVGDVVGRGPRAAALMGQLRTGIRAYAIHGLRPAELMSSLGQLLLDLSETAMATAVYGVLDVTARTLELVSAGHPPPVLVTPSSPARYLALDPNLPLGVLAPEAYATSEFELPAWSTLVLYTDGLVEDRSLPIDEGLAHLLKIVDAHADGDVERLGCELLDAMVPDERADDVAILAARLR
ncbi:MAG: SpoIIE family protein phosphatase [Egibacteraceae bacterium]